MSAAEQAPHPGSPEHAAAMTARFDKAHADARLAAGEPAPAAAPAEKPAKPEGIPEKFWNPETGAVDTAGMAKAYAELERKQSAGPKAAEKPAEPATVEPPAPDVAALEKRAAALKKASEASPEDEDLKALATEAEAAIAKAKEAPKPAEGRPTVDLQKYTDEFVGNGSLSDESYAELEKAGYDRPLVDSYVAGQHALIQARMAEGHGRVGGAEQYNTMMAWAKANLSPEEKVAFNTAVGGDSAAMGAAIDGLHAKYKAAVGTDPKLLSGTRGGDTGAVGYASAGEMKAAMRDPRYRTDAAYRAEVERKTIAAKF